MENPIKMDDLGVPLFLETPISIGNYTFQPSIFRGISIPQISGMINLYRSGAPAPFFFNRVLKGGGCPRWRGNCGSLRISREDSGQIIIFHQLAFEIMAQRLPKSSGIFVGTLVFQIPRCLDGMFWGSSHTFWRLVFGSLGEVFKIHIFIGKTRRWVWWKSRLGDICAMVKVVVGDGDGVLPPFNNRNPYNGAL